MSTKGASKQNTGDPQSDVNPAITNSFNHKRTKGAAATDTKDTSLTLANTNNHRRTSGASIVPNIDSAPAAEAPAGTSTLEATRRRNTPPR